ncbi:MULTISPECIES: hypothetical protein [Pseudomonas syringae group]|uniref:hypothetical protein n=1 Tax=Pseudomonas syringae group TaxID=136849 RepID=UPI0006202D6B|nr:MULTISPECIES: hypothetical protein [Pseudomonas syringae group]QVI72211.1 hypothetical protein KHW12_08900 [Pseudomonas syringae]UQW75665.1 hypothetical protein L2Y01_07605 [Pseudomonas avellanae]UZS69586.1 hypothetical protein OQB65_09725 [Pseudomonas syringae]
MNSAHQAIVLQILTAVMAVNAQGKLEGFFDYSGHVRLVDVRFYEAGAFGIPDTTKKSLHTQQVWLDKELHVSETPGDSGEESITASLIGMLEFVQSLLQPTDQPEGEQAA